jgi:hypothetical protein
VQRLWWALAVVTVCACGAPPPPPTPGAGFIALDRDFAPYRSWEASSIEGAEIDVVHTAGTRTVFLNRRPQSGATEWPVGTVFVKELSFTTFAMVKRGAGYNTKGAQGWEWFELFNDTPTTVAIKWRGLGPPLGENYSKSGQTCNDCHGAHVDNDSVMSPGFRL